MVTETKSACTDGSFIERNIFKKITSTYIVLMTNSRSSQSSHRIVSLWSVWIMHIYLETKMEGMARASIHCGVSVYPSSYTVLHRPESRQMLGYCSRCHGNRHPVPLLPALSVWYCIEHLWVYPHNCPPTAPPPPLMTRFAELLMGLYEPLMLLLSIWQRYQLSVLRRNEIILVGVAECCDRLGIMPDWAPQLDLADPPWAVKTSLMDSVPP